MRIFILSTGRCGSTTIIRACEHISNFSARHESRAQMIGATRFDYPDFHIESDNRLSWFLGGLDFRYGNDAFYVHLLRDRHAVSVSYNQRWSYYANIMSAFSHGIVMYDPELMTHEKGLAFAEFY